VLGNRPLASVPLASGAAVASQAILSDGEVGFPVFDFSGTAKVPAKTTSAALTFPEFSATSTDAVTIKTVDGLYSDFPAFDFAGSVEFIRKASSALSFPEFSAASTDAVTIKTVTGNPEFPAFTVASTDAVIIKTVTGNPTFPALTAFGTNLIYRKADGNPTFPAFEASGADLSAWRMMVASDDDSSNQIVVVSSGNIFSPARQGNKFALDDSALYFIGDNDGENDG
jgi:hypothetical protein